MEQTTLWPSGPFYHGESIQTDALALSAFARVPKGGLCADLGCGCGILPLLLLWERRDLRFHAVELRDNAAKQAQENMLANGFSQQCTVYTGDMRQAPWERGRYDLVITNPPYFPPTGRGEAERRTMRQESMSLTELCALAFSLLKNGGRFTLCYPAVRAGELIHALEETNLPLKRLRCVQHSAHHAPSLILCESRKNAGEGLIWEPPLLLQENGEESQEYKAICHRA